MLKGYLNYKLTDSTRWRFRCKHRHYLCNTVDAYIFAIIITKDLLENAQKQMQVACKSRTNQDNLQITLKKIQMKTLGKYFFSVNADKNTAKDQNHPADFSEGEQLMGLLAGLQHHYTADWNIIENIKKPPPWTE